ncbi:diaminopimelate epimerase [Clostridia bacterium]|nr:diaminopimelate epimerase [Clostridia bacterium]
MKFSKMHGIGNDYVYINCFEETVKNPSELAKQVSNRNFGVGSDGLILIYSSEQADCRMEMYNADGSRALMCGNGIRCVGKYVYDHGLVNHKNILVETDSGVKELFLEVDETGTTQVIVDMGIPELMSQGVKPWEKIVLKDGTYHKIIPVSVGNPHAVVFVKEVAHLKLTSIGPKFEFHERFPDRVNTEFVQIINRKKIKIRVWERGSGETLACGTGACAAVFACILAGLSDTKVEVELLGGKLEISRDPIDRHMKMKGPAVEVFSGEFKELINE